MTHEPADLMRAHGPVPARGRIRCAPEDFLVDEQPAFAPSGEGEHVLLHVRKRDTNTDWLARRLARHAGVRPVDVGFAGLKDRDAVTTQWFSIHLPGKAEPDWRVLEGDDLQLLRVTRHHRKVRRGALRGNAFSLVVRSLHGDRQAVETRLRRIGERGVPNYFGLQRFGRDGGNLNSADALFAGRLERVSRHRRGLYLSAARSHLFNCVLGARVEADNWDTGLPGDLMALHGSRSVFSCEALDKTLRERLAAHDIHPTGPLWGRGPLGTQDDCRELERRVLEPFGAWREGLERAGMKQERRSLRVVPADVHWRWDSDHVLRLQFALPAGSYATAVLREVLDIE
jgi:tRNA pseudouridine13 synthase